MPRIEDGQKITHDEVIEEGATILTLGVLDMLLMGLIYDQVDPGHSQGRGSSDRVATRLNQTQDPSAERADVVDHRDADPADQRVELGRSAAKIWACSWP